MSTFLIVSAIVDDDADDDEFEPNVAFVEIDAIVAVVFGCSSLLVDCSSSRPRLVLRMYEIGLWMSAVDDCDDDDSTADCELHDSGPLTNDACELHDNGFK